MQRLRRNKLLIVGIAAMVLLIVGTLVEQGTVLQKSLFLVGAPVLGLVAHLNGQRMLTVLQGVITIAAVIAFIPGIDIAATLAVLVGPALVGVAYLVRINYRQDDPYWPIGGLGLLLLAVGLAVSGAAPLLFNALLATGAAVVMVYALLGYLVLNIRIQAIWVVLNILFAINPALRVLAVAA